MTRHIPQTYNILRNGIESNISRFQYMSILSQMETIHDIADFTYISVYLHYIVSANRLREIVR